MLITIDKRGSINLPLAVRKELGLEHGSYLDLSVDEGGKIICGGNVLQGGEFASGCYVEPTIAEVSPELSIVTPANLPLIKSYMLVY